MGDKPQNADRPAPGDLPQLLRYWRRRLDHTRFRGVDASRRRLKPGLTQQEVAALTGVGLTWYRELERGKPRRFSENFLQQLATVLRLDEAERVVLFRLAAGYTPSLTANRAATTHSDEHMQAVLDQMLPHPAYLTNLWWDIVAHNRAVEDWFPWIAQEQNLMRFAFLHPEARRSLVDWRRDLASPSMAQIRYALAAHPDSPELRQLRDDILAGCPEARELWNAHQTQAHPGTGLRRFNLPHHEGQEARARIMAFAPLDNQDMRFVVLLRV